MVGLGQRRGQYSDDMGAYVGKRDEATALRHIEYALHQSQRLLHLADDWDGEGGSGYAEITLTRVRTLVWRTTRDYWRCLHRSVPAPAISPAQDGSIDACWRHGERRLLVNVPAAADEHATFYGEGAGGEHVGGTLDTTASNVWLLLWLTG